MACAALKSGLYFLKMLQNRNLYHEDQHGAKLKFAYRRATVISLCTNSSAKFSKPNTNLVNHHPFGPLQKIRISKYFSKNDISIPKKHWKSVPFCNFPHPIKKRVKSFISTKMSSIFTANSQKSRCPEKAHFLFHEFVFWWPMDNQFSELAQSKPKPPADWSEL